MDTERIHQRRKRRRLKGIIWFVVLLFGVTVVLPRWTKSVLGGWWVPTVLAETGPLEETVSRRALALWREHAVESPGSGSVHMLVADGERVQKGQAVAVLRGPRTDWRSAVEGEDASGSGGTPAHDRNVYAPLAGVIRFDWIGPRRPDPAEALSWPDDLLAEIGSVRQEIVQGASVRAGDALFRVVENHRAYMLVPWEDAPPLQEGQRVWVRTRVGDEWQAVVRAMRPVPSGAPGDAVLLSLLSWPPQWDTLTWMDVDIVVRRYEGTIVPDRLLTQRGNRWGVFVKGQRGPLFHSVDVLGRVGDRAAVRGLSPGVALMADPP